jgi:hypothetical protein
MRSCRNTAIFKTVQQFACCCHLLLVGLHHRTFRTFFSFVNCDRADVLVASAEHMLSTSKRKRYGQARAGAVETRRQGVQDDRTSTAEAGKSQPLLRKIVYIYIHMHVTKNNFWTHWISSFCLTMIHRTWTRQK